MALLEAGCQEAEPRPPLLTRPGTLAELGCEVARGHTDASGPIRGQETGVQWRRTFAGPVGPRCGQRNVLDGGLLDAEDERSGVVQSCGGYAVAHKDVTHLLQRRIRLLCILVTQSHFRNLFSRGQTDAKVRNRSRTACIRAC